MPANTRAQTIPASNKPVISFKSRGLKVSVFENVATNGENQTRFYKATLQRFYKDKETGDFKLTQSLGRDDLPIAQHLLQKAWSWILETESSKSSEEQETST